MIFYYFAGEDHSKKENIKILKDSGFSGALFTYSPTSPDYISLIANRSNKDEDFKCMIAIRPYLISPQYLRKISNSFNELFSTNEKLQFNFISGYIKKDEIDFGGILGEINDHSSKMERSKYLIEFLKEINKMEKQNPSFNKINFFTTTTNPYVFDICVNLDYKMIMPYKIYKESTWDIFSLQPTIDNNLRQKIIKSSNNIMFTIYPVIRETKEELDLVTIKDNNAELYTYEELYNLIIELKEKGINYLMFGHIHEEKNNVMLFMEWLKNHEL